MSRWMGGWVRNFLAVILLFIFIIYRPPDLGIGRFSEASGHLGYQQTIPFVSPFCRFEP